MLLVFLHSVPCLPTHWTFPQVNVTPPLLQSVTKFKYQSCLAEDLASLAFDDSDDLERFDAEEPVEEDAELDRTDAELEDLDRGWWKKNNGASCRSNGWCKSNYCYRGKCKSGKKGYGSYCILNSTCQSGRCQFRRCVSAPRRPARSNKRRNGQYCWRNSICQSNNCVRRYCKAKAKKGNYASCRSNSECRSNYCK